LLSTCDFFMNRFECLLVFSLAIFFSAGCYGIIPDNSGNQNKYVTEQDTLLQNQILYNGRVWRNLYFKVRGNQFLFTSGFLPGTVTINGKLFNNINIRYDIYKDEIMTMSDPVTFLQFNKEMVDRFSILSENKLYQFEKIIPDSSNVLKGYVNVLYKGKTSLYVKYKKVIELLAVDGKFDRFYQFHRIYVVKDEIIYPVTGKKELLNILVDRKPQIKDFIKTSRLKVSKNVPESFVPVLEFYDRTAQ
jgi:hypothetical protein